MRFFIKGLNPHPATMMHNRTAVEVTCLSFNGRPFSMEEAARRMMDLYPDRCLSSADAWHELEASGILAPKENDTTAISFAAHKLRVLDHPYSQSELEGA